MVFFAVFVVFAFQLLGAIVWKTYRTTSSVDNALRLLAEGGKVIAGGTDLLVEMRRGAYADLSLVDVSRVDGFDRIRLGDDGMIHIGPGVTHNQAAASRLLNERAAPLALACRQVGTPQIRNRGTIAGNLVTASPANDTIAALRALDARVAISSARGARLLPLSDFYLEVRRTVLQPGEMVTDIVFPALRPNQRGTFVRMGLRRANTIALVNAGAVLTFDGDTVSDARIALGSVAPTIFRAAAAERSLAGKKLGAELIDEAAALCAQAAAPITDVRGGADYRREAVRFLVRRALESLRNGRTANNSRQPMLWGRTDGHFPGWIGATVCHNDQDPVELTINGKRSVVRAAGGKRLLDLLREDLGFTGTKEGCGEGECGACTVWMDGIGVLACLVPAPRAHGTSIVTIEGMARGDVLHPLQQAFIDEGAVQCGYCSPGFIMAGASLLDEIPHPTGEQIRSGLSGNLCRCTGYYKIMRAVERAAERNIRP